jgi:putative ABC transport system ATP-binding protein
MNIVSVEKVSQVFPEGEEKVRALDQVSCQVAEGEFVALCGPSGSGKTTLLNLMGCLMRPHQGSVEVCGHDVSRLSQKALTEFRLRRIGFVFQDYNLIPTFTAIENIEYVLWLQKVHTAERHRRTSEIAKRFGIDQLLHRRPDQLSRGQQQRVAVARAVVHRPRLVLGDELTANLDHKTGASLMDFLRELNRTEKIAFIYATHDPVMMEKAGRVIRLKDGVLEP